MSFTRNTEESFWAKVDRSGDCWLWNGYIERKGYGLLGFVQITGARKPIKAHRVAWVLSGRELPPSGYHLHHTCGTKACVNPDHLEVIPASEHGRLHNQVGCHRHGFDHWYTSPRGTDVCRVCQRERKRRFRAAQKVAA